MLSRLQGIYLPAVARDDRGTREYDTPLFDAGGCRKVNPDKDITGCVGAVINNCYRQDDVFTDISRSIQSGLGDREIYQFNLGSESEADIRNGSRRYGYCF